MLCELGLFLWLILCLVYWCWGLFYFGLGGNGSVMVSIASSWKSFPDLVQQFGFLVHLYLNLGSRKVDFKSFVLLSKPKWLVFSVVVFSVVSWYRDDFNFSYDRKCNLCKSSQVSMLGFELMKETVSNSGVSVLCFYASLTLGWEQLLFSCYLLWS